MSARDLLANGPKVIGVGLQRFVDDLKLQGVDATALDWRPPASNNIRKTCVDQCKGLLLVQLF